MADQQEPSGFFKTITPAVVATLIVALVSVCGALGVAVYNSNAQRTLEREQFESNLILKAIGTGDKKLSYDNLRFLIEGGLVRKESEKVSRLLQDTSLHFHIPNDKSIVQPATAELSYSALSALPDPTFSGVIVDEATLKPIKGAAISIKTNRSGRREIESKITDFYGRFTLHYPPRNFTLSYSCPGFIEENTWHFASMKFGEPLIIKMKRLH